MDEHEPPISARLLPSDATAQPGGRLTFTVLNTGARTISFGTPYRLELMTESGWRRQRQGPSFTLQLFRLAPGHARELNVRLPPRMSPGTYRLIKEIGEYPPGRSRRDPLRGRIEVSFEFEVGGRPAPPPSRLA